MRQGSGWRTRVGKMEAGRSSEVADCGAGWTRQQLVDLATDHTIHGSSKGEIKPQTTN